MTDKPDLRVVDLHEQAMAMDIVGSLHRAADNIVGSLHRAADNIVGETAGHDRTVAAVFVQVSESGDVAVYGWGQVESRFATVGALHAAIAELLS